MTDDAKTQELEADHWHTDTIDGRARWTSARDQRWSVVHVGPGDFSVRRCDVHVVTCSELWDAMDSANAGACAEERFEGRDGQ